MHIFWITIIGLVGVACIGIGGVMFAARHTGRAEQRFLSRKDRS